jgi:hypothetical protein
MFELSLRSSHVCHTSATVCKQQILAPTRLSLVGWTAGKSVILRGSSCTLAEPKISRGKLPFVRNLGLLNFHLCTRTLFNLPPPLLIKWLNLGLVVPSIARPISFRTELLFIATGALSPDTCLVVALPVPPIRKARCRAGSIEIHSAHAAR